MIEPVIGPLCVQDDELTVYFVDVFGVLFLTSFWGFTKNLFGINDVWVINLNCINLLDTSVFDDNTQILISFMIH